MPGRRHFFEAAKFVSYSSLGDGGDTARGAGDAGVEIIVAICLAGIVSGRGGAGAGSKRSDKVSFYFAAHEDDWQLLMNPSPSRM